MSREIKFRAWSIEHKKMSIENNYAAVYRFKVFDSVIHILYTHCHLMQYTGLKDKNGKEIYEGDIVICILNGNAIGANDTVTFKNGSFWLNRRNIPISEWYDKDNAEFEVIGNIYQP